MTTCHLAGGMRLSHKTYTFDSSVTFSMSAFSFIFMLWDIMSHAGAYTDLCGYHRSLSVSLAGWAALKLSVRGRLAAAS